MAEEQQRAKLVIGIELDKPQAARSVNELRQLLSGAGETGPTRASITGTAEERIYAPETGPRGGGARNELTPLITQFKNEMNLATRVIAETLVKQFKQQIEQAAHQSRTTTRLLSEAAKHEELGSLYSSNPQQIFKLRERIQNSVGQMEELLVREVDPSSMGRALGRSAARSRIVSSRVADADIGDLDVRTASKVRRQRGQDQKDIEGLYESLRRGEYGTTASREVRGLVERNDPTGNIRALVDARIKTEEETRARRENTEALRRGTDAAKGRGAAAVGMTPDEIRIQSAELGTRAAGSRLQARLASQVDPQVQQLLDRDDSSRSLARKLDRQFDRVITGEIRDPGEIAKLNRQDPLGHDRARDRAETAENARRAAELKAANAESLLNARKAGSGSGLLGPASLQDIRERLAFDSGQKQADRLGAREIIGQLPARVREADALARVQDQDTASRRRIARQVVAGNIADPGLPGLDLRDAQVQANRQARSKNEAALKERIRAEVGELDETIAAATELLNLERSRRQKYEALANVAAKEPGRVGEDVRRRINAYDPSLLADAEREAQRDRLRHFFKSDASPKEKIDAIFRQAPPGEQRIGQTKGSFFGGVLEGFIGDEGRLDKSIGQALKFSALYGGLYRIQALVSQGFAAAATGAADYEEALIALNLATTASAESNEALADAASKAGTALGVGPAVGVQAATRAIGLYDLNNPDVTDANRTAVINQSRDVGIRLSQVTGQPVDQIQGQIAGLIRSFDMSPQSQTTVEDQVTIIARQSGQSQADILSASSQLATAAKAAGFDAAETMAIVAQIASTTSQTPDAVAGALSQIFSKADDPAAKARLAGVGVDVTGTNLNQQFAQLAGLNLDQATQNQTVQAFGRGRSGQALSILLNQYDRIEGLTGQARNAPPGEGERAFDATMLSLRKQLTLFAGYLQEAANGLAKAGLFQAVEHAVFLLVKMAQAIDHVVEVYNLLPEPLRDAIGWILEIVLALKILDAAIKFTAARQAAGGVADLLANVPGGKGVGRFLGLGGREVATATSGIAAAKTAQLANAAKTAAVVDAAAVANAAGKAGIAARVGTGISAASGLTGAVLGRGLAFLGGPIGLAIGAVVQGVAGAVAADAQKQLTTGSFREADRAAGGSTTAKDFREAAAKYDAANKAAAKQQEISFGNTLETGGLNFFQRFRGTQAERTEHESLRLRDEMNRLADSIEQQQADAVATNPGAAFQDFGSAEAVAASMDLLTRKGYNAQQSFEALAGAMEATNAAARLNLSAATAGGAVIAAGQGSAFAAAVGGAAGGTVGGTREAIAATNAKVGYVSGVDPVTGFPTSTLLDPYTRKPYGYVEPRTPGQGPLLQPDYFNPNRPAFFQQDKPLSPRAQAEKNLSDALNRTRDQEILDRAADPSNQAGKKANADASAAVTDYLKEIGKDPSKGNVVLSRAQVDEAKRRAMEAAKKDFPEFANLSKEGQKTWQETFNKRFSDQTGQFLDFKPTVEYIQSTLDASVKGAISGGEYEGALAMDDTTGARTKLKNIDRAIAAERADADLIPDLAKRKLAYNAIDTAFALPRLQAQSELFQGQATEANRQAAFQASQLDPDQSSERNQLKINALNRQLGAQSLSADQLAQLKKERDSLTGQLDQSLTGAQRAEAEKSIKEIDKKLAAPNLDPRRKIELETERNEATSAQEAGARQARNANAVAGLYFNDQGQYTGATQRQVLNKQLAQARAEIERTKGFADDDQAKAAARQQYAQLNQQSAGLDLGDKANKALLNIAPGFALDDQKAQLVALNDQIANATKTGADVNALRVQARQLQYEFDKNNLLYAQSMVATDSSNPVMAAKKILNDLLEQQAAEKNPNAKKAYDPRIAKARGDVALAGFSERQQAIQDAVDLGLMTKADSIRARQALADSIKVQLSGMKDTDEDYYALTRMGIDVAKSVKAASNEFQGQFNLGDIKVPTVYEIRRSLGTDANRGGTNANTTNHVSIQGADFARVVEYLNSILGKPSRGTRGNGSRSL